MLEVVMQNIEKSYGANVVLTDTTLEIQRGERIGLIGRNGTGKTTILKIIAGLESYDKGTLSIRKGSAIGWLDQIPDYNKNITVLDVLNSAFDEVFALKEKMRELEEKMAASPNNPKLMKQYGDTQIRFENKGGYNTQVKLDKICTGLKISEYFQQREFNTLSGGEKTRICLGKILLESPDILLLDEPTNHLDIESVEWLEEFLTQYPGAVMIISHDRYFLDVAVTKIIELEDGKTEVYHGNYSYYVTEREQRFLQALQAYKNQQKKIKAMEEAIERYRIWGTINDESPFMGKAKEMERRLEKMDKMDRPTLDKKKIGLDFSTDGRSGRDVVWVKNLRKSFGSKLILNQLDFFVRYREKVAVLGKNGSGKSTLIKILLGEHPADFGQVKIGTNVKIGYLEQEISIEDQTLSVLEAMRDKFPFNENKARRILAKFLFFGDDVFKKVMNLSGGEKVRLELCLLMHQDINLLILDEPTNHLDIDSREMFEEALSEFDGTVIFISHDRYFINKIAQRIVEIDKKKLAKYPGNYDYYKQKKSQKMIFHQPEEKKETTGKTDWAEQKRRRNQEKKRKRKIEDLEKRIEELEGLIDEKNRDVEACGVDYDKQYQLYQEKVELEKEHDFLYAQWCNLTE